MTWLTRLFRRRRFALVTLHIINTTPRRRLG